MPLRADTGGHANSQQMTAVAGSGGVYKRLRKKETALLDEIRMKHYQCFYFFGPIFNVVIGIRHILRKYTN